ncbi:MAG: YlbF family regulator [Oscillospiraceae bacterium]|nr:YlbF family regulator [Oscillospiraceae bacterium]
MKELKTELVELIAKVGEMVRADERYVAFEAASDAYAKDPEIATALTEYNVQQQALAAAFGAEERDEALVSSIQNRIGELYKLITENPVYVAYREAGEEYETFTKAFYGEIEYAITGQRPSSCTHDCSTCGGCH